MKYYMLVSHDGDDKETQDRLYAVIQELRQHVNVLPVNPDEVGMISQAFVEKPLKKRRKTHANQR